MNVPDESSPHYKHAAQSAMKAHFVHAPRLTNRRPSADLQIARVDAVLRGPGP